MSIPGLQIMFWKQALHICMHIYLHIYEELLPKTQTLTLSLILKTHFWNAAYRILGKKSSSYVYIYTQICYACHSLVNISVWKEGNLASLVSKLCLLRTSTTVLYPLISPTCASHSEEILALTTLGEMPHMRLEALHQEAQIAYWLLLLP